MLFEYATPARQAANKPAGNATVWSLFPLQPLAPGAVTPFSYSVLAELASRAWYVYYDRLGFDPTPRSRVVRRHKGHVYFNLSLCAQLEAQHAGVEPLSLRINGERQPLAAWEKPGFLAGFKLGRGQKKIEEVPTEYKRQIDAITEKARAWYQKTQAIKRWGQAEVLQIMEEIERVGVDGMAAFFAARYNLGQQYARLMAEMAGSVSTAQAALLINQALCGVDGLVETSMLAALSPLAAALKDPAALAWAKAGDFANWRTDAPNEEVAAQIRAFLDQYGHRAALEGEAANPRWSEDVTLPVRAALTQIEQPQRVPTAAPKANTQPLLNALPSSARKQAAQTLHKLAVLHQLQSAALHSLAYIWAGTRTWALAAAREAMVDNRLQNQEDVFLFELEEIKQMMTGEWNISSLDEIHATTAQRKAEQAAVQQEDAPDLLVGDDEAFVAHQGLPGVEGTANGPLQLWDANQDGMDTIVAAQTLDSGLALALPQAAGFVAASGTPYDPFVAVAQRWQRPVGLGLGKHFRALQNGAAAVLNVTADAVSVEGAGQ